MTLERRAQGFWDTVWGTAVITHGHGILPDTSLRARGRCTCRTTPISYSIEDLDAPHMVLDRHQPGGLRSRIVVRASFRHRSRLLQGLEGQCGCRTHPAGRAGGAHLAAICPSQPRMS